MASPSANAAPEGLFNWPWGLRWPMPEGAVNPFFALAPGQLTQPINPGWSFGNVIVNNGNSSAPQVEQEVVSQHSYGRQIGRMMDALQALVAAVAQDEPALQKDPRVQAFQALADDVQRIKDAGAQARIARLQQDLLALKAQDPQAWKRLMASVR
jgi:hypothetical protein